MKRWARGTLVAGGIAAAGLAAWRVVRPARVEVAAAARGNLLDTVYASGTVEPESHAEIDAQVRGELLAPVGEGERVAAGQLLARIDNPGLVFERERTSRTLAAARARTGPELRARRADLAAARVAETDARTRLDRTRTLARQDAVTTAELDAATAAHDRAVAEVEAAASRLAAVDESLAEARGTAGVLHGAAASRAADADVRSPIDGIVVRRHVEAGEFVTEGQPLFRVGDLGHLVLDLLVDEADVGALRVGQPTTATFDAFPRRAFAGRVSEIAPDADRESRTYRVEVRLDKVPEGLRPGMTAEATIEVGEARGVVLVPSAALTGDRLWVVEDGRASRRRVDVGIRELTWVEVRAGVEAGALVIIGGPAPEEDGARVSADRVDLAPPSGATAPAGPLSRGE